MTTFICLTLIFLFTPINSTLPTITSSLLTTFEDADFAEGRKALIERDYPKALESFTRFSTKKPNEFDAHYYLGLSYYCLNQYTEAIAAFKRAAEIIPKSSSAQYELGKAYLEMENYEAALKQYHWLQENDLELASYLYDMMPREMIKQHLLQSSQLLVVVKEKKEGNSESETQTKKSESDPSQVQPMSAAVRPQILYKEKAKYTAIARTNYVQGTVVLNMVFASNCEITNIRVVRGLPDGLTIKAIEAVKNMRFKPALRDGQPISLRGNVEFNFTLY